MQSVDNSFDILYIMFQYNVYPHTLDLDYNKIQHFGFWAAAGDERHETDFFPDALQGPQDTTTTLTCETYDHLGQTYISIKEEMECLENAGLFSGDQRSINWQL